MHGTIDVAHWEEQVKGPGKFEGESAATPYFWDAYLNGDGEETESGGELVFDVTDEEREAFSLTRPRFYLYEDEQGFCYGGESL